MTASITFNPDGTATCLWTEVIDLLSLGRVAEVRRATNIEFDITTQQWRVLNANNGVELFTNPSREACIQWERANL
jgi:hypothetical protein